MSGTELPALDPFKRPTVTVEQAGAWIGLSRAAAYEAARRDDLPTITINGRKHVRVVDLLGIMGLPLGTVTQPESASTVGNAG